MDEISKSRKILIDKNAIRFRDILKFYNYNLIGYCELVFFDNVFIFETQEEADEAFKKVEKSQKELFGFWYGKEKFLKIKEHIDKKYVQLYVSWIKK